MTRSRHLGPRGRHRLPAVLAGLATVLALAAVPMALGVRSVGPAAARVARAAAAGPKVTLTPAGPYTDGQTITVHVANAKGLVVRGQGECPAGTPSRLTSNTWLQSCSIQATGSSHTSGYSKFLAANLDGVIEFEIQAGVGKFGGANTKPFTCDRAHPCRLVLSFGHSTSDLNTYYDASTPLTFKDGGGSGEVQGCGGQAADPVPAAAPDRLATQVVSWAVARCQAVPSEHGSVTNTSLFNEAAGLSQFESGLADLAYGAASPSTPAFGIPNHRAAVYTPVAINAAVVAASGLYGVKSSVPTLPGVAPLTRLDVTAGEAADIYLGNTAALIKPQSPFSKRNAQFRAMNPVTHNGAVSEARALAGAQATTLGFTTYFDALARSQWTHKGKPIGPIADFNLALGGDEQGASLAASTPQLSGKAFADSTQAVITAQTAYTGILPVPNILSVYLTDLATAHALDLQPVSIANANGAFVAPTTSNLTTAASHLAKGGDGLLRADPKSTQGYPLTYVEYVVTPAQPLLDDSCKAKTAEQTNLKNWVSYLIGDGQKTLAANGLMPLTPALKEQAQASLAQIGAAPATGKCAAKAPPATSPDSGPGAATGGLGDGSVAPGSFDDTAGSLSPDSGDTGDASAAGSTGKLGGGPTRAASRQSVDRARKTAAQAKIPFLSGPLGAGILLPLLSLPLLVALTSGGAWVSSGQPMPTAVGRAASAVADAARRTAKRIGRRRGRGT